MASLRNSRLQVAHEFARRRRVVLKLINWNLSTFALKQAVDDLLQIKLQYAGFISKSGKGKVVIALPAGAGPDVAALGAHTLWRNFYCAVGLGMLKFHCRFPENLTLLWGAPWSGRRLKVF